MIRLLAYFGPIAVLAILVTGVAMVFVTLRGPGLDNESQAFVDCAIPAITATWDQQSLVKRASPELLKANADGKLDEDFARYKTLGRLQAYEGSSGDSGVHVGAGGLDISGVYFARGRFEKGNADFKIALAKSKGDWQIHEFAVESAALPQSAHRATPTEGADPNVEAYGTGIDGFERWCRATFSAWAFRYQSSSELWIAMSDTYGPYPTSSLASRIGAKYLTFVDDTDKVRVILFRTNEKGAEATVGREEQP
jgi:hypothetical protein